MRSVIIGTSTTLFRSFNVHCNKKKYKIPYTSVTISYNKYLYRIHVVNDIYICK